MIQNKEPLISVIVPIYNGEKYLAACVQSIEEQTYPNLEVILINDGSTDGTGQVCVSLQKTYGNVQILTLGDEGVSVARNAGIEAAKGEFVMFVDADDRLRPNMLRSLYDCMLKTGSDIMGCRFFLWKSEEEWMRLSNEDEEKSAKESVRSYPPDVYIKDAVLRGNSRCWSKLYRKSVIDKTRFRAGLSIGEDMLFLIDALQAAEKITEMEYAGYGYFQNPRGAINRGFIPEYMDQITCWEIAREKIEDRNLGQDACAQVTSLLMIGIMLTVGKLAMLPRTKRQTHKQYVSICHEKLKENMVMEGAFKKLPKGYQVKTKFFLYLPGLYLQLYHMKKAY